MTPSTTEIGDLVSLERGEVDRRIYSDPSIFEREMEQIFGRAWLGWLDDPVVLVTGAGSGLGRTRWPAPAAAPR